MGLSTIDIISYKYISFVSSFVLTDIAGGGSVTLVPGAGSSVSISAGAGIQWQYSFTTLAVLGDLSMYNSQVPIRLSALSGLYNASMLVTGTMTIGYGMGWNMWASGPQIQNTLVVAKLIVSGGQLFFGCTGAGCAVGSTSTHVISAANGTFVRNSYPFPGSIVIALPSIGDTVEFDDVTLSQDSSLLNVSSGALSVAGLLTVVGTTNGGDASVVVYDALDSFLDQQLATLNVFDTFSVTGGAMLRIIGLAGRGTSGVNSTGSPYAVVFAPTLLVDSNSFLRIDYDPTEGVAIPSVKIQVETFSGPVALPNAPGAIMITGSTNPSFYQPFIGAPLPQIAVLIQWDTNTSPITPTHPQVIRLTGFPDNTNHGVNVNSNVTDTALTLVFSNPPPPEPLPTLPSTGGVAPTPSQKSSTGGSGGGGGGNGDGDGPKHLSPGAAAAVAIVAIAFVSGAAFVWYRYRRSPRQTADPHASTQHVPLSDNVYTSLNA